MVGWICEFELIGGIAKLSHSGKGKCKKQKKKRIVFHG
jgi:hypothetical protein